MFEEIIRILNNNCKVIKRTEQEYCIWVPERDIYIEGNVASVVYGDDNCRTEFVTLTEEESNKLKVYLDRIIASR